MNGEARVPRRSDALIFSVKAFGLRCRRAILNLRNPPKRHLRDAERPPSGAVLTHRSPLWTEIDPKEQALQFGKVQNLRVAMRSLDGVTVPAGELFSFWCQVGRATRSRGYVAGREIREGCVIPTIGGGLCQLSNALYDLAVQAGFEICERHSHSQALPGSAWERGRDATIAWNYVDLRFRSNQTYRIQATLTADELVVRFLLETPTQGTRPKVLLPLLKPAPGSCETCGQAGCFRHSTPAAVRARCSERRAAFLLDAVWPEFDESLQQLCKPGDLVLTPLDSQGSKSRYAWSIPEGASCGSAGLEAWMRAVNGRRTLAPPLKRALMQRDTDRIARRFARLLTADAVELVVDIAYLKELYRCGELGGRRVTVLMSRFPLRMVHELLEAASLAQPASSRLRDYRADDQDVEDEWSALQCVKAVETPHAYLAERLSKALSAEVRLLDWKLPSPKPSSTSDRRYMYFPGPTTPREGAIAVREAAMRLGLPVAVGGRNLEAPDFWNGVEVLASDAYPMSSAAIVVCPAVMKNCPSELLQALASGKPVIATQECGLPNVVTIPFGDADALTASIAALCP